MTDSAKLSAHSSEMFCLFCRFQSLPFAPCCSSLCKSENLSWDFVLLCVSPSTQLTRGQSGTLYILPIHCIYGRPIMQQPQHVLTASYFSTAFIFRLALLTYKGTENWRSQLLPTVQTIQEGIFCFLTQQLSGFTTMYATFTFQHCYFNQRWWIVYLNLYSKCNPEPRVRGAGGLRSSQSFKSP